MLDPQLIRNDLDRIASVLEGRGIKIDKVKIQDIENQRKSIQIETEKLQAQRNLLSKEIGDLKSKNKDTAELLEVYYSLRCKYLLWRIFAYILYNFSIYLITLR